MIEEIKSSRHITSSLKLKDLENRATEEATADIGGVVILPPIIGDSNTEVESYPADYVEYSLNRMKEYKKEHGELPEWEQDKEQKIERALTLAIDKELALQAMAIDAFLADAEEAEILHFNELALPDLQRKELESNSKYAPKITAQRGFSNGEHISHGFFTKMPAAI